MNHPHTHCERRAVRDYYITKNKKRLLATERWRRNEIPHEGDDGKINQRWDGQYTKYLKYLRWLEMSEDERKIAEVQAVLDGEEFEPPKWDTTIWSKFSKRKVQIIHCHCCCGHENDYPKNRSTKNRRELDRFLQEGLEDYCASVAQW